MIDRNINKEYLTRSHLVKIWTYISVFNHDFYYEAVISCQKYILLFINSVFNNCSDTSIPIFEIHFKSNFNEINCFRVQLYRNWLIRPTHKVLSNNGSILYYKTNQISLVPTSWDTISAWNSVSDSAYFTPYWPILRKVENVSWQLFWHSDGER